MNARAPWWTEPATPTQGPGAPACRDCPRRVSLYRGVGTWGCLAVGWSGCKAGNSSKSSSSSMEPGQLGLFGGEG